MEESEEGWCTDPYGTHDARWMSAGMPTSLVRDGELESHEDPPDTPPSHVAVRIEAPPGSVTWKDTLRADAAEATTMPSLAELERTERSVAITTEAHPWFLSRRIYQRKADRLQGFAQPDSSKRWTFVGALLVVAAIVVPLALLVPGSGNDAPPSFPREIPPQLGLPIRSGFHYIGTLVVALAAPGSGTVRLAYSVVTPPIAPLAYPTPKWAEPALDACGDRQSKGNVAVLARVSVTLHGSWSNGQVSGGFVTTANPIGFGDISSPVDMPGGAVVDALQEVTYASTWACGESDFAPGNEDLPLPSNSQTSFVLPMVVIAESAINPASPRFNPSANPEWAFTGTTISGRVVSGSGPHAFVCGDGPPEISLFATPPFDIPNPAGGGQISCHSPST
jgi:hypothetical protein